MEEQFTVLMTVSDNNCTFQVLSSSLSEITKQGPRLFFQDSVASVGQTSVSAISIYKCQQIQLDIKPNNLSHLYDIIFLIEDDYNNNKIYSNPARIVPCIKGEPQHNYSNLSSTPLHTYPGKELTISLAALDGRGKSIEAPVEVQFYHSQNHRSPQPSSWWLSECESEQTLYGSAICTKIGLTIHSKQFDNSSNDSYSISTAFFSFPNDVLTFQANILLTLCPPGFQLNDSTFICECSSFIKKMNREYGFDFICDTQNGVVKVPNSVSWIGCYNNSEGQQCEVSMSPSCFRGFCNYSIPHWSTGSANKCIESREGTLCGSCIENYSTVFGSNRCYQCTNWWLFTIVFYAVAGLLLIAFLFALNLTISTGTLNGLIFFANMFNAGLLGMLSLRDHDAWVATNHVFISLLNLGLGYPLCFYDGMKEMVKSWLQLVFPVYLLTLVALVVVVCRYSIRLSSLVYTHAVPVLVTVVHISFSRLFLAVIDTFSVGHVYTADGNSVVWLRDGNVPYFSPQHIALMIVSFLLAAVFILPYLILLLGARWWIKFETINLYFKPILDAAHGPFKENKQYWFSLRLILLLQQQTIYAAFCGEQTSILYLINGPIIIAFTILHTSARPFKSKAVNILDGLIMLMLCLIVYACSELYYKYSVAVITLSSLVAVVFLVFISYHILLAILKYCSSKSSSAEKAFQYLASLIGCDDAPPTYNAYQPINGSVERKPTPQFREPLLDVSYGST